MRADYTLSHSLISNIDQSIVDLLIKFKADETQVATRRPLNLSIVIDRSGSMAGKSLQYAVQAARSLVEKLHPEDILSIVVYDDNVDTILSPQQVTDKDAIYQELNKIKAGGCTNLHGGWLKGCEHIARHRSAEKVNRVLLLTDGQANVGIKDSNVLISNAKEQSEAGITTTTLGFGSGFNEDLLIGMAHASAGNFYYIQSPDEAGEVFRIELESLSSVVAQNIVATVNTPANTMLLVLNNYPVERLDHGTQISLGDAYSVEDKLLALELLVPPQISTGLTELLKISYRYQTVVDGSTKEQHGELPVQIKVGTADEAVVSPPDLAVIEQANRLRIARAKDEAIELSDKGDLKAASQKLRKTITDLKLRTLRESFEVEEELDQLDHFAQQMEKGRFDPISRKEMRDQSFQARSRNRGDLKLRGIASGSAQDLEVATSADQGVVLKCVREGGKLRVRVVSDGFNQDFNVQFPRNIRDEGITYLAEEVTPSADGTFYKVSGSIKRLVLPGEVDRYAVRTSAPRRAGQPKAAAVTCTAADLETTNAVGTGVLVQCVKEGSKLRARVVSDGYDPNFNMRFPRSIREEGILYVVDEVIEPASGGSYIACGKIKRLIQ